MSRWCDSHCHLDFVELAPQTKLLAELAKQGCCGIVVPATTAQKFAGIRALANNNPGFVLPAFGLHPYFMQEHTSADLTALRAELDTGCVAVGEIGLDFMIDTEPQVQADLFRQQLQLAKEYALPVILHARQSLDEISAILKQEKFTHGGIVHAFSGSLVQAQRFIDLGFVLGFGGAVTYSRANKLRNTVCALPLSSIVLETDAPDMRPSFVDGHNSPLYLPEIARHIAALRNMPLDVLLNTNCENLSRILKVNLCMH
jgi:TatD DNase family protein